MRPTETYQGGDAKQKRREAYVFDCFGEDLVAGLPIRLLTFFKSAIKSRLVNIDCFGSLNLAITNL